MASVNMKDVKVELFYADWCGHCNQFKPEWQKLKKMLDDNGIKWGEYESERDSKKMDEENINGYPTIRISIGGNKEEYKGERTANAILSVIKNGNKSGSIQNAGGNNQCGGARGGFTPRKINKNNENNKNNKNNKNDKNDKNDENDEKYKIKYFKYKAKYMKMLAQLEA